jgi:formate dehydrogenase iron-sulfur subunit
MAKAILVDTSKCIGCRGCQVACKQWHGLPAEATQFRGTYENPPDLSAHTWRKVRFIEATGGDGRLRWRFISDACKHCADASCLAVCPTGALSRRPWGAVDLNQEACNGCRYCVAACPFGVVTFNEATGRVDKCTLCPDRVEAGLEPACVATCPTGALTFGDREAVLDRARKRIAALAARGANGARIYGERELSGLHAVYVLQDRPEVYGLPEAPRFATASVLPASLTSVLASLVVGVGALVAFRRRGGEGEE